MFCGKLAKSTKFSSQTFNLAGVVVQQRLATLFINVASLNALAGIVAAEVLPLQQTSARPACN